MLICSVGVRRWSLRLFLGAGLTGCGEPVASPKPEGAVPGECDDRADNDQDGLFDCADEGCAAGPDCNENQVAGDCGDGADNDADGAFDCDDSDCASDVSCLVPPEDACDDWSDNDADGSVDCADGDCVGLDGCDDFEGDGVGECRDGRDNDGDGSVDCDDANCAGSPDCVDAPSPREGLAHPTLGTLRYIPPGSFTMGCVGGRDAVTGACVFDETPAHTVTLTQGLWMVESELTQAMWNALGYANPSAFVGGDRPVEQVSWWDAVEAANAASARDGLSACYALTGCSGSVGSGRTCASVIVDPACTGWRLPTEAEWEYAARGGESFAYAGSSNLDAVAWTSSNLGNTTHAVCGKQRNGYGLCDMTGNVYEWTGDWYGYYGSTAVTDPRGPSTGSDRVYRGGGWYGGWDNDVAFHARVALRSAGEPGSRNDVLGFRLLRSVP